MRAAVSFMSGNLATQDLIDLGNTLERQFGWAIMCH